MHRRTLLASLACLLVPNLAPSRAMAHSPWGQYAVYRQKHLLVLSTRDDAESYPYSKLLVDAVNRSAPEAKARPARAKDLERAYNLLRSDQFQFALLSRRNVDAMRSATGLFAGGDPVDLKSVYLFGQLEFAVRADFPAHLVAIVAHAVVSNLDDLPGASPMTDVLGQDTLHAGARDAIIEYLSNNPDG